MHMHLFWILHTEICAPTYISFYGHAGVVVAYDTLCVRCVVMSSVICIYVCMRIHILCAYGYVQVDRISSFFSVHIYVYRYVYMLMFTEFVVYVYARVFFAVYVAIDCYC